MMCNIIATQYIFTPAYEQTISDIVIIQSRARTADQSTWIILASYL